MSVKTASRLGTSDRIEYRSFETPKLKSNSSTKSRVTGKRKALRTYGIKEGAWSNDEEMFALVHQMRARVITSPSFNGDRIVGTILFEGTKANRIFGTKMRSFIKQANAAGVKAIVSQQFEVAAQISAAGLVPIVEPEVDIHCPEKAKAEALLKAGILEKLNKLPAGQLIMLKVTLPEEDNFYADCIKHPNVLKVVALSGGYSPKEANERLRRNHGLIASFSRALLDGLLLQQSDEEYDAVLDAAIQSIYEASNT
jgi:fructose-bisphosphate aldolase class I